jgi:hypothetical protein
MISKEKFEQTLGDGPIEIKYREYLRGLAQALDEGFNGDKKGKARKTGFVLMVFEFGDKPGRCNYISNAERSTVTVLLKEQLARFEGQPEVKGHA